MKEFQTSISEITRTSEGYSVAGRNAGDESITIGDFIEGLQVRKIETYHHSVEELPPGMTGLLTLVGNKGNSAFYFTLRERSDPF